MTNLNLGTSGPPETVLPEVIVEITSRLDQAMAIADEDQRRDAISSIVADHPRYLDGWARLGELGRHPIERYAAFRVGYHRGLDHPAAERLAWIRVCTVGAPHQPGIPASPHGLHSAATEIGEDDEAERTAVFLHQLDPTWPPSELA